jgi:hypothetical protein
VRENVTLVALVGLSLIALTVVIGGIILGLDGKTLDSALIAIGSGAAGAIGGLVTLKGTSPE